MRKSVKFLHTLSACGLIGALLGYAVVLYKGPSASVTAYADARQTISALCNYLLLPSMAVALVSGLLSMAVHRPFQDMRWVWVKALSGISVFEAVLGIVQSKANDAAAMAAKMAAGAAPHAPLANAVEGEWYSLWAIMALSLANIVLGIWRPALKGWRKK